MKNAPYKHHSINFIIIIEDNAIVKNVVISKFFKLRSDYKLRYFKKIFYFSHTHTHKKKTYFYFSVSGLHESWIKEFIGESEGPRDAKF